MIRLSWDLPRGGTSRTSAGHHRQFKRSGSLQGRARFLCLAIPYGSELPTVRRCTKKAQPLRLRFALIVVIRLGFEPKTHSLEGCCSIQLSYRTDPCCFRGLSGPFEGLSELLIPKVAANIGYFFESSKF